MLFHLMMVGDDVFGYKSVELYEPGMKWWDAYAGTVYVTDYRICFCTIVYKIIIMNVGVRNIVGYSVSRPFIRARLTIHCVGGMEYHILTFFTWRLRRWLERAGVKRMP